VPSAHRPQGHPALPGRTEPAIHWGSRQHLVQRRSCGSVWQVPSEAALVLRPQRLLPATLDSAGRLLEQPPSTLGFWRQRGRRTHGPQSGRCPLRLWSFGSSELRLQRSRLVQSGRGRYPSAANRQGAIPGQPAGRILGLACGRRRFLPQRLAAAVACRHLSGRREIRALTLGLRDGFHSNPFGSLLESPFCARRSILPGLGSGRAARERRPVNTGANPCRGGRFRYNRGTPVRCRRVPGTGPGDWCPALCNEETLT
jgi:hypothetical protein